MELIYLWVEKFRNIRQLGFDFSSRFKVSFELNNALQYRELKVVSKKELSLFEGKIDGVTAIIGKNGSGKTNLLDLLGMRMDERKKLEGLQYFMLYHISGNTFAIEGSDFSLISRNVLKYPNEKEQYSIVTEPYSMYLKKRVNGFEYSGFLQLRLSSKMCNLWVCKMKRGTFEMDSNGTY